MGMDTAPAMPRSTRATRPVGKLAGAKPGSCGLALEMVRRCFAVARYEELACLIAEWLGISLARRGRFHQSTSSGGNPGDSPRRRAGEDDSTGFRYGICGGQQWAFFCCILPWAFGTKEEPLGVRGSRLWKSYLESVSSELG